MLLDEIFTHKAREVRERKRQLSLSRLADRATSAPAPPRLGAALHSPGVSVIAEFKRRSPSAAPIVPSTATATESGTVYANSVAAAT